MDAAGWPGLGSRFLRLLRFFEVDVRPGWIYVLLPPRSQCCWSRDRVCQREQRSSDLVFASSGGCCRLDLVDDQQGPWGAVSSVQQWLRRAVVSF